MTPELVREAWDRFNATVRNKVAGEYGPFTNQHWADICAIWQAHADALEEIERLAARVAELEPDAERYRWILRQATITDFIFRFTKSRERHVSNAIDDARKTK